MPSPPVPAATLILLQDGPVSPRVLLLQRDARSDLLPDAYVFPGGRVEEDDARLAPELELEERGLSGLTPRALGGLMVAAIRETFEEAGLLLVRHRGQTSLLTADDLAALHEDRRALQSGRLRFAELIARKELELAFDTLVPHARWITPEIVPRRFDTFFFAARAPRKQVALHDGVEASSHVWIRPEDALAERERGERAMIFPTACNLESLVGFDDVEEALAASRRRPLSTILPVLELRDGRRCMVIPRDAGYSRTTEPVEALPRGHLET
ncbi:MAG: NUDIX hydrolase [Myxococcota bacterium]